MNLANQLSALEESGLIHLVRPEPEEEYGFRHALIHEAAYQSLVRADRQFLHRHVAEAIERHNTDVLDAYAFVLGWHWREAGQRDRARAYFMRAGAAAQAKYANREAIASYSEALALTDNPVQRFELLVLRTAVYDVIAARAEQRTDVEAMLTLAEQLNSDERRCDALIALADYYLTTDYLRAQDPAERAAVIARALGDERREGRALYRLGVSAQVLRATSNLQRSRDLLTRAAVLLRGAAAPAETAACLSLLGVILVDLKDPDASQEAIEEAISLSRSTGDKRHEAINLRRLAEVRVTERRYEEALQLAQLAVSEHRDLGDQANECDALITLGMTNARIGKHAEARSYLLQSLTLAENIGLSLNMLSAIHLLREAHFMVLGEYEAALRFIESQRRRVAKTNDKVLATLLQSMYARMLAELGQYAPAIALRLDGLPHREGLLGRADRAGELALIASWQAEVGDVGAARQHLAEALSLAEDTQQLEKNGDLHLLAARTVLLTSNTTNPAALDSALASAERAVSTYAQSTENSSELAPLIGAHVLVARVHLARGDVADALSHSTKVIELAETTFPAPRSEQYCYTKALALRAAGRDAEAHDYLRRAYERTMQVAGLTNDPEIRLAWLTNVRDNRNIIAEWQAYQQTGPTNAGTEQRIV